MDLTRVTNEIVGNRKQFRKRVTRPSKLRIRMRDQRLRDEDVNPLLRCWKGGSMVSMACRDGRKKERGKMCGWKAS